MVMQPILATSSVRASNTLETMGNVQYIMGFNTETQKDNMLDW